MLILTTDQMSFAQWQIANSDCLTLADCLAVHADLEIESAWMRMREGETTRADVLLIESEHDRELRANPSLADCPDFRANIARLLASTLH